MIAVDIQIDSAYEPEIDATRLIAVVENTLQLCGIADAELTLVVTSDEAVCALNRRYRSIDAPTDVLSFEAESGSDGFILPPDLTPYLGDVIIAAPTAIKQATRIGHSAVEEILFLAIHGTLHLLGFDHLTPTEKAEMWQKQNEILRLNHLSHLAPTEQDQEKDNIDGEIHHAEYRP